MRLPLTLFFIFLFAVTARSFAHMDGKLHFLHLKAENRDDRSRIANYIHIDSVIEKDVYATVNSHDLVEAKAFLSDLYVTSHSLDIDTRLKRSERGDYEFPDKDRKYHTYDEIMNVLQTLARDYSDIATLSSLGKTIEGRDIPLIRITAKTNKDSKYFVPGIIFTGSHHAREHLSTEVPLLMAKYLLENYNKKPEIKRLVDSRDIYIAPLINVDGKLHDIEGRRYKRWRKNRRINEGSRYLGVDLNRNYSYGWGTGGSSSSPSSDVYMGPEPFSEPETQAIKKFIEETHNIRMFISFHTFSELILYPWGGQNGGVGGKDQEIFEKMANDMSKWNGYRPMQSSDLYIASGDTCDWAYGEHNIYCFTFELTPASMWSGGFYPGAGVIDSTFNANINPTLYLLEYTDDPSRVLSL